MSGEPVFFPDVEALIVTFLAARPELADIPVDVTPPEDFDGTALAVVVSRVGGGFTQYQRLDSALVDLETYGPDKTAAHDLARTVRALVALMPTTHHDGAVVSDVAEDRGPRWQPDRKSVV